MLNVGVPSEAEGFRIPPEVRGPLSAEQKLKLIHLQDGLYVGYQTLASMFNDSRSIEEVNRDLAQDPIQTQLMDDPYLEQLFQDRSLENLKKAQEYLFWKITFRKYKVIGIEKLKPRPDGTISEEAMTLEDVLRN